MNHKKSELLALVKTYPDSSGIYLMRQGSSVIYVGKAKSLTKRLQSYFDTSIKHVKTEALVKKIDNIDYILTLNPEDALILEQDFIKKYRPKYNILLKDDKSYPYVVLSGGDFPRLFMMRGPVARLKYIDQDAICFGPFTKVAGARNILDLLQKTFMLRSCKDYEFKHRTRPCLQFQLARCKAPCVGYVNKEDYNLYQVSMAKNFLLKNLSELKTHLKSSMQQAADNLDFDQAIAYRDMLSFVDDMHETEYVRSQMINIDIWSSIEYMGLLFFGLLEVVDGKVSGIRLFEPIELGDEGLWDSILCMYYDVLDFPPKVIRWPEYKLNSPFASWFKSKFAKSLGRIVKEALDNYINMLNVNIYDKILRDSSGDVLLREDYNALVKHFSLAVDNIIVSFDISHTQGDSAFGACVVFSAGKKNSLLTKVYSLGSELKGDDLLAMKKIAQKFTKFLLKKSIVPDIIVVDGGGGQLETVYNVMKELNSLFISIKKDSDRTWGKETVLQYSNSVNEITLPLEVFKTLLRARDAAHITSGKYHRKFMLSKQYK